MLGAIAELRGKDQWLEQLLVALRNASPLPWPGRCIALRLWSVVTAAITLVSLIAIGFGHHGAIFVMVALLLMNSTFYSRIRKTLNERIRCWRAVGDAAGAYLHASRQAAEDLPDKAELGLLRKSFERVIVQDALPTLCKRTAWTDAGGMFHVASNLLLFYDLHVVAAIMNTVLPRRDALIDGLNALADLGALTSLACFAYESGDRRTNCYPAIIGTPGINICAGRHPLIVPEHCIPNDVRLDPATRMWIITGSNMSGKSTLLRMTAINSLLAQIGTIALAKSMSLSPLRLVSDLQARDNLAKDESYFLAEVRHVRRMVIPDKHRCPVFGVMDEPFRGTNSEEQLAAAMAVVEQLLLSSNLFLVATHENALTHFAEKHQTVQNYHYRENMSKDGLVFDYQLRNGPAATRNALKVLEQEGYPAELLARARDWLQKS